jgi:hypothetical protein
MTYPNYPGMADVESMLSGIGITVPSGFDVQAFIDSAIAEWCTLTTRDPFLCAEVQDPPVYVSYTFDPPGPNYRGESRGGGRVLFLRPSFVTVQTVRAGVDIDNVGTLLAEGRDYRLKPYNAAIAGKPYTSIEFTTVQWGGPASIEVSGEPGYCRELKADAWNAIRSLAASYYAFAIVEASTQNPVSWKRGETGESFDAGRLDMFGQKWRASGIDAAVRYTRLA